MTNFALSKEYQSQVEMEQKNEEKNTNIEDVISKSELFIEQNQKTIITVAVAVLVVAFAIFGFVKWYAQPRLEKASNAIFGAEQYLASGQYQLALDGNDQFAGFNEVAKKYGSTKVGKRAKYQAGLCYLHLGQYNEAIDKLNSYKGKDTFTKIIAVIAQGDAQLDLQNNSKAISLYKKAAQMDDNYVTTPFALFKAGMVYIIDNNSAEAIKCFQQIKDNYPEASEYATIDKFIKWAEAL